MLVVMPPVKAALLKKNLHCMKHISLDCKWSHKSSNRLKLYRLWWNVNFRLEIQDLTSTANFVMHYHQCPINVVEKLATWEYWYILFEYWLSSTCYFFLTQNKCLAHCYKSKSKIQLCHYRTWAKYLKIVPPSWWVY